MIYVLYHASCRDGFAAAYAAWKRFGSARDIEYIPVRYDNPPPRMKDGATVYILDFSYPRDVLEELNKRMSSILVLDHHKTAQEALEGLDYAIFRMDRSGATLAWEYFHPLDETPDWMYYIEDRDLWKWKYEESDAITEAIGTYPHSFEVWDNFETTSLLAEGKGIVRFRDGHIKSAVRRPIWQTIGGHDIPTLNNNMFVSHTAHALCDQYPEAPFAACYFDIQDNKRVWSLRSVGEFDVSEIAKQYGGGGHKNAAGFVEELVV